MPSAICNICDQLVHWWHPGQIKKQTCSCGSKDLTAVAGTYNADDDSWVYHDRKGNIVKNVTRETFHGCETNQP